MEPILTAGADILFLSFSSALSGTFQNSLAAVHAGPAVPGAGHPLRGHPMRLSGAGASGLPGRRAAGRGGQPDELTAFAEERSRHICHWFTVDDPRYLKRGGRAAPDNSAVGARLHVEPILRVDEYGCLRGAEKVRGRKAAMRALVDKAEATASPAFGQTVFISHGDCPGDAGILADMVRQGCGPPRDRQPCGTGYRCSPGPGTPGALLSGGEALTQRRRARPCGGRPDMFYSGPAV